MLLIFVISYLFFLIYFILFCLWHVPIIYAWVATTSYLVPVSDHVSSVTKFFRSFMKYIIYNSSHSIIGFWYWQVLYVIYYLLMFCWVPDPELYALILFLFIRILSIWLRITRLILSSNALFHVNCFRFVEKKFFYDIFFYAELQDSKMVSKDAWTISILTCRERLRMTQIDIFNLFTDFCEVTTFSVYSV